MVDLGMSMYSVMVLSYANVPVSVMCASQVSLFPCIYSLALNLQVLMKIYE